MNGFVMQETYFPFICTIIDDASTDGEAVVIRKYLDEQFDLKDKSIVRQEETDNYVMTFARHRTNLNCYFAVYYLKYNHHSIKKTKKPYYNEWTTCKYIATCEGDDYWVDPCKLQKQVLFLERSPGYGLVYTNHYNDIDGKLSMFREKGNTEFRQIVLESGIGTLTACYRTEIYNDYIRDIQPQTKNWLMGDSPLWKYMAFHSKIKFLPDYTAVYRVLPESASHSRDYKRRIDFVKSGCDVQLYFIQRYMNNIADKKKYEKFVKIRRNQTILAILFRNGMISEVRDFVMNNKKEISCWMVTKEAFRGVFKRYIISKL